MEIDFKYNYPYCGYGDNGRYRGSWSESRTKLNGCYTYPFVFNNTVPCCTHIKVSIEIENTGAGTVLGRAWEFLLCKSSGGWVTIESFILPEDGLYTVDCDIGGYDITKIAFVPSSNPGSSRTWSNWYEVEEMTITETVTLHKLNTGTFHYGVLINQYGIEQRLNEVYVNIDGVLKMATGVFVNISGEVKPLGDVFSGHLITDEEQMVVYSFEVPSNGKYKIRGKSMSGDHELRIYDENFNMLLDDYFYSESFSLMGGSLLYISVTHYFLEKDRSESYIQIYKEM